MGAKNKQEVASSFDCYVYLFILFLKASFLI